MTPEQEAGLRTIVAPGDIDRWFGVALETNTPGQSYRAAAMGLTIDEWEPCARAGATSDAAFAAIRQLTTSPWTVADLQRTVEGKR